MPGRRFSRRVWRRAAAFLPTLVLYGLAVFILLGVARPDFSSLFCAAGGTAFLLWALALGYLSSTQKGPGSRRLRRWLSGLCRVFEAGAAVFFVFFFTVQVILQVAQIQTLPPGGYTPDAVVVFGAAVRGNAPTPTLRLRIRTAYGCLTRYPEAVAVLTGGLGNGERRSEAELMAEELARLGIAPQRLIREPRARNTRENVDYSLALLDAKPGKDLKILAVSNGLHIYRIRSLFAARGVTVYAIPAPHPNAGAAASLAIREVFSVLNLWLGHPI